MCITNGSQCVCIFVHLLLADCSRSHWWTYVCTDRKEKTCCRCSCAYDIHGQSCHPHDSIVGGVKSHVYRLVCNCCQVRRRIRPRFYQCTSLRRVRGVWYVLDMDKRWRNKLQELDKVCVSTKCEYHVFSRRDVPTRLGLLGDNDPVWSCASRVEWWCCKVWRVESCKHAVSVWIFKLRVL